MMMNNQNDPLKLIAQARELLSPYLDGEVTSAERQLVDAALGQSPQLRAELESLRHTTTLVRQLPRISAPRPFTLTQADVGPVSEKKSDSRQNWFKPLIGAMAALTAVVAAGFLLVSLNARSTPQTASVAFVPLTQEAAAPETAVESEAAVVQDAQKEVESAAEMAPATEAPVEAGGTMSAAAIETPQPEKPAPPAVVQPLTGLPSETEKVIAEDAAPGMGMGGGETVTGELPLPELSPPASPEAFAVEMAAPLAGRSGEEQAQPVPLPTQAMVATPLLEELPPTATASIPAAAQFATEPPPTIAAESPQTPAVPPAAPPAGLTRQSLRFWLIAPAVALIVLGTLVVVFVFSRPPKNKK